jgi:hypothetical protein
MATSLFDIGHLSLGVALSDRGQLRPKKRAESKSKIMKITSVTAALGAALLLAGAPALATAAEMQTGPIQLNKVEITQSYGDRNQFSPGLVTVAFTNQNASPATDIVFALESDGNVIDRYEDVGSYAKGETVRHSFQDIQIDNDQQLTVEKATFADGSVWSNGTVSYAPAASTQSHEVSIESIFPFQPESY